jgi:hypothetical protein
MGVRFHGVGVEIEFAVQTGMHRRQMVALEIVVDVGFPVALHVVDTALEELHILKRKSLGLLYKFAKALRQWPGVQIQIHEYQVEPFFTAHRGERKVFGAEPLDIFDLGGVIERAIKVVGPSVIDAHEAPRGPFRLRAHDRVAHIVERAQLVGPAHHE